MKLPLILLTTVLWLACGGSPEAGPPWRPEHPRPAMRRTAWLNLNGVWSFRADGENQGLTENWAQESPRFPSEMKVPFPWQSADAGAARVGWYRREIALPAEWPAPATWLRTEGVGGEAQIWIDGELVGTASSGFGPLEFEVTELLKPGADSEIVVRVEDVPGSDQSGLIGTVWLEGRPRTYVSSLDFRSFPNGDSRGLEAHVTVRGSGGTVDVALSSSDPDVGDGRASAPINGGLGQATLRLPIANAQGWSPESSRLYPLTVRLTGADGEVDVVEATFGLRTIEQEGRRILVNGQPQYLRGIVAPRRVEYTDEDLHSELERIRAQGFNMLYAPAGIAPRMRYWADQLGLWTISGDENYSGPSELRGIDVEVSESGSDVGSRPLLISVGPQPLQGLAQFFRDFTNRVRRLDFATGYVWGADLPDMAGYDALVPEMTAAHLQGADYVGLDGPASFEAKPGDKLTLHPFVSRFSVGAEPLRLQVALRAVNDLGGAIEFFSAPRQVSFDPGQSAPLADIVMTVPQSRGLAGTLTFELSDASGRRVAANYVTLLANASEDAESPRSERIAPRRTALRVEPGAHDGAMAVEYSFPAPQDLLAARPIEIEVLAELAASPADARDSVVRATLNDRLLGEITLPDAPQGPAGFLGDGASYGYLARMTLVLTEADLTALHADRVLVLRLESVAGSFAVFGERSGRYAIDPTVIVVTENVPGP